MSDDLMKDMQELLARAYKFDDKPHQLFSALRAMAEKYEMPGPYRDEIFRVMDLAYGKASVIRWGLNSDDAQKES